MTSRLTRVTHRTGRTHAATDNPAEGCLGLGVMLWCPGCAQLHQPTFRCPEHGGPFSGPVWDGDPHSGETPEGFTMEPSLLVRWDGPDGSRVCHSFVRRGHWEFLGDSTHDLAGQTVALVELPEWLLR